MELGVFLQASNGPTSLILRIEGVFSPSEICLSLAVNGQFDLFVIFCDYDSKMSFSGRAISELNEINRLTF